MNTDELRRILASLPEEELPDGFHGRLQNRLVDEVKEKPNSKNRKWYRVAAGLVAVLLVFVAIRIVDSNMLPFRQKSNDFASPQSSGLVSDETESKTGNSNDTNLGLNDQSPGETISMSIYLDKVLLYVDDVSTAKDSLYDMANKRNIKIESQSDNIIKLSLTGEGEKALIYTELELIGRIEQTGSKSDNTVSIYMIED